MAKKKISVLIVEDDKYIADAYEMKFKKVGFKVKIALSGRVAFEILKEFKPQIIILDLIMPIIDGFEILRQLKNNKDYKNIPVIVASNLGGEADIKEAMDLGAYEYVVKTRSTLESLIKKIESVTKV